MYNVGQMESAQFVILFYSEMWGNMEVIHIIVL